MDNIPFYPSYAPHPYQDETFVSSSDREPRSVPAAIQQANPSPDPQDDEVDYALAHALDGLMVDAPKAAAAPRRKERLDNLWVPEQQPSMPMAGDQRVRMQQQYPMQARDQQYYQQPQQQPYRANPGYGGGVQHLPPTNRSAVYPQERVNEWQMAYYSNVQPAGMGMPAHAMPPESAAYPFKPPILNNHNNHMPRGIRHQPERQPQRRPPNHFCNCLAMKGKLRKSKEWTPKGKKLMPIGTIQGLKQWHMESKLGAFYQLSGSTPSTFPVMGEVGEETDDEKELVEWRITLLDADGTPNSFVIRSQQTGLDMSYLRASHEPGDSVPVLTAFPKPGKRRDYFDRNQAPWEVYIEDVTHVFCTCAYLESHLGIYFVSADLSNYQPIFKTHLMRSTQRVPIALAVRLMPFCRAAMRAVYPEGLPEGDDRDEPIYEPGGSVSREVYMPGGRQPHPEPFPPLPPPPIMAMPLSQPPMMGYVEKKQIAFYPTELPTRPPGNLAASFSLEAQEEARYEAGYSIPHGSFQGVMIHNPLEFDLRDYNN